MVNVLPGVVKEVFIPLSAPVSEDHVGTIAELEQLSIDLIWVRKIGKEVGLHRHACVTYGNLYSACDLLDPFWALLAVKSERVLFN